MKKPSDELIKHCIQKRLLNKSVSDLCFMCQRNSDELIKSITVHLVASMPVVDNELVEIKSLEYTVDHMTIEQLWKLVDTHQKTYRVLYAKKRLFNIMNEIEEREKNDKQDYENVLVKRRD